ncbi:MULTISPECIES: Asp23/Gls24 family envelope stress response protein [unclassified Streptomyces]|uniref:Asp23/Gls24 family envelope stress response protein n=1 Tax=unclassified Streptomyces TaxID=2593676 RepID=UPI0033AA4202
MTTHTDPPQPQPRGEDDEQLPCGRSLPDVWDTWEQGTTDPHTRDCPHCRQAVDELEALQTSVHRLNAEPAGTEPYDTLALTQRVMDVVRLELRPGHPLPLGEPDEDIWIMEAVAARTVRAAAETVDGVRAGSCRITPHRPPAGDPSRIDVRLEIHAPLTADLPSTAEQVRQHVLASVHDRLGLVLTSIDIQITDLVDANDEPEGGQGR